MRRREFILALGRGGMAARGARTATGHADMPRQREIETRLRALDQPLIAKRVMMQVAIVIRLQSVQTSFREGSPR